ncbi:Hypothetical predicted protein [Olea europaea subsp. europaea]|uniref:Uncharacterized protein n=1 Tax=Olea europaea subsp. europaea TaxID=158383 RepID=A0A8S0T4D0_OLEEU|nr:Hypothetical predicted protein [Olea europaea subsp. europaea]
MFKICGDLQFSGHDGDGICPPAHSVGFFLKSQMELRCLQALNQENLKSVEGANSEVMRLVKEAYNVDEAVDAAKLKQAETKLIVAFLSIENEELKNELRFKI